MLRQAVHRVSGENLSELVRKAHSTGCHREGDIQAGQVAGQVRCFKFQRSGHSVNNSSLRRGGSKRLTLGIAKTDHGLVSAKNPRVDQYIKQAAPFARPILKHIREVVHCGCPDVTETIKWGMPQFEHNGIICAMAAFKAHCAFHFWRSEVVLGSREKENEAMGQFGRITSINDLPGETELVNWVRKAVELRKNRVPGQRRERRERKPLPVPSYLAAALNQHPKAKKTFENFSPSHRREYVQWLIEAKRDKTREKRLKTAIEWLSAGKPRNWRYTR